MPDNFANELIILSRSRNLENKKIVLERAYTTIAEIAPQIKVDEKDLQYFLDQRKCKN